MSFLYDKNSPPPESSIPNVQPHTLGQMFLSWKRQKGSSSSGMGKSRQQKAREEAPIPTWQRMAVQSSRSPRPHTASLIARPWYRQRRPLCLLWISHIASRCYYSVRRNWIAGSLATPHRQASPSIHVLVCTTRSVSCSSLFMCLSPVFALTISLKSVWRPIGHLGGTPPPHRCTQLSVQSTVE